MEARQIEALKTKYQSGIDIISNNTVTILVFMLKDKNLVKYLTMSAYE